MFLKYRPLPDASQTTLAGTLRTFCLGVSSCPPGCVPRLGVGHINSQILTLEKSRWQGLARRPNGWWRRSLRTPSLGPGMGAQKTPQSRVCLAENSCKIVQGPLESQNPLLQGWPLMAPSAFRSRAGRARERQEAEECRKNKSRGESRVWMRLPWGSPACSRQGLLSRYPLNQMEYNLTLNQITLLCVCVAL